MKKIAVSMLGACILSSFLFSAMAQNATVAETQTNGANKAAGKKTMTWTTTSEAAKGLAAEGTTFFMNNEFPQAYEKFYAALQLDPDFTVPLAFMANMAKGETRKALSQKTINSAVNKTEGEKLFASLAAANNPVATNRETWAKLHAMFPDGSMIGYFYVLTRPSPEERFKAAQDYINQFPDIAAMYNTIAYYYMLDKKDMASAKKHFEKYIELYPTGCNPYDSMGEYYLTNGDKENAKKYYMLALEKYPFNSSSVNAIEKMQEEKKAAKTQ